MTSTADDSIKYSPHRIESPAMTGLTPRTFELRCKDYDVSSQQKLMEVINEITESHEELELELAAANEKLARLRKLAKAVVSPNDSYTQQISRLQRLRAELEE